MITNMELESITSSGHVQSIGEYSTLVRNAGPHVQSITIGRLEFTATLGTAKTVKRAIAHRAVLLQAAVAKKALFILLLLGAAVISSRMLVRPSLIAEAEFTSPRAIANGSILASATYNSFSVGFGGYAPATTSADAIMVRTALLRQYLTARSSPLAPYAHVIAAQSQWKTILAISFAESSLGKSCVANNCSGIGGSNLVEYDSVSEWVIALNVLLEKRYRDKTVGEMCGVYVQPCNPNWLLATNQIFDELQQRHIE